MKLRTDIRINGKLHPKGSEVPLKFIYPFFLIHMLMFGASGFLMAYGAEDVPMSFLYMHGGIAITVYLIFYLAIFGVDEIKWMFINAGLGLFGIISQIDWILDIFGKSYEQFSIGRHVIPFLYFVLYTFLLRQAVLDVSGARENEERRQLVDYAYVGISLIVYYLFWQSQSQ